MPAASSHLHHTPSTLTPGAEAPGVAEAMAKGGKVPLGTAEQAAVSEAPGVAEAAAGAAEMGEGASVQEVE